MTPLTDAELDGLQERLSRGEYDAMAASAIRSLRTERDALQTEVDRRFGIAAEMINARAERDVLRTALEKMAALYESEYDADLCGEWKRPDWLRAAMQGEQQPTSAPGTPA